MKYLVFGLRVDSEVDLPDCFEAEFLEAEVTISYGPVDGHRIVGSDRPVAFSVQDGSFLFERYGVARFEVSGGRRIRIDLYEGASLEEVRTSLLGSVFAALLHQRGILALHASAVEINGQAVLFAGQSGAGKSTLAAVFATDGFVTLADDVSAVHPRADGLWVYPSLKRLKLWESAVTELGMTTSTLQPLHSRAPGRYRLPLYTESLEPRRLKAILLLAPWPGDEVVFQEAQGSRLFNLILRATYRAGLLGPLQAHASHFAAAFAATQAAKVGILCRPQNFFNALDMKEKVLELLSRC